MKQSFHDTLGFHTLLVLLRGVFAHFDPCIQQDWSSAQGDINRAQQLLNSTTL